MSGLLKTCMYTDHSFTCKVNPTLLSTEQIVIRTQLIINCLCQTQDSTKFNMDTQRQMPKRSTKRDMAKNSQQGKRTSWIHDIKGGRHGGTRLSCVEETDWWPHSPQGNKIKMIMRQLHLSTDQVFMKKKSSTCNYLLKIKLLKCQTLYKPHLFFIWFWC